MNFLHKDRTLRQSLPRSSGTAWRWIVLGVLAILAAAVGLTWPAEQSLWKLHLQRSSFGPIDVLVTRQTNWLGRIQLRSASTAISLLQELPGAQSESITIDTASLGFKLRALGEHYYVGQSFASREGDPILLSMRDSERLTGHIDTGWFRSDFEGEPAISSAPLRDYPEVVRRLREVVLANIFDQELAEGEAFQSYLDRLAAVAQRSHDDVDLMLASRWAWEGAPPFSHFELRRSEFSAEQLEAQFNVMNAGPDAVSLEHRGAVSILRIGTMMGLDTAIAIERMMSEVAARSSEALVIDLRGNAGGAFAIKPLVECVLDRPFLAGVFLTRAGRQQHKGIPDLGIIAALPAWEGSDLAGFWQAVRTQPMVKIELRPREVHFAGVLYVLIDRNTASAAEIAADALRAAKGAVLIGERSAGQVLSAGYYDLVDGFQVSMPVADFYAQGTHRLEGHGLEPDVAVSSDRALDVALEQIALRKSGSFLPCVPAPNFSRAAHSAPRESCSRIPAT